MNELIDVIANDLLFLIAIDSMDKDGCFTVYQCL